MYNDRRFPLALDTVLKLPGVTQGGLHKNAFIKPKLSKYLYNSDTTKLPDILNLTVVQRHHSRRLSTTLNLVTVQNGPTRIGWVSSSSRGRVLGAPRASISRRWGSAVASSAATLHAELFHDHGLGSLDSLRTSADDEVLLAGVRGRCLVDLAVSSGCLK